MTTHRRPPYALAPPAAAPAPDPVPSRAAQRKQRLLELENEQRIEDAEALKMTEEQRLLLFHSFRSVKFEWSDLDGMRSVKRRYNNSPTVTQSCPPSPPLSPVPGRASSGMGMGMGWRFEDAPPVYSAYAPAPAFGVGGGLGAFGFGVADLDMDMGGEDGEEETPETPRPCTPGPYAYSYGEEEQVGGKRKR